MNSRRLLLATLTLVFVGGAAGCGDSKGDRPAPAASTPPTSAPIPTPAATPAVPAPAPAPTQWTDPKDLLKALRAALVAGETARVVALYDASDPAAAVKKRFWGALAESFPIEGRIEAAYVKKFGQAAWDADANSAKWGTGGDFGLVYSFLRLNDARVDEEDGTARVGIDKFVFHVVRRDGKCVAFREETFGGNDGEVKGVVDGIARARKVLAAVDTSSDAATFEKRFAEIRAQ